MRGLWKIHHAIQSEQARRDWVRLSVLAIEQGHAALVKKLQPPEGAGWRTIDKQLKKLREALGIKYDWEN